jgi:hypothetical protein
MRLEAYPGEILNRAKTPPKVSVMLRFQYNVSDASFRLRLRYLATYVAARKLLDIIFNTRREQKSSYPRYFYFPSVRIPTQGMTCPQGCFVQTDSY